MSRCSGLMQSQEGYAFDKMMISYRSAACRQRPQPLKAAKLFQSLTKKRLDADPDLKKHYTYDEILTQVIDSYHSHHGVKGNASYQVRDEELEATRNIALYVDPEVVDLALEHLHQFKWVDSG